MNIALITPAGRDSRSGNRHTALRWARLLRELKHRVRVQVEWDGDDADCLLALHARKSFSSIRHFSERFPDRPLLVTLTGTDLYRDIATDADAQKSLALADRLIVLQDDAVRQLPAHLRAKTHVVYQSAQPMARKAPLRNSFEVLVIGHLRAEKDPLRTALALRHLPEDSRVRVHHFGKALDAQLQAQAEQSMQSDPRYRWLGERAHWQVRQHLARARLMVISSRMEGGANVVSEALAAKLPVIASYVSGNIGMLGRDYAGYFPLGDERGLAQLLLRAETDARFYRRIAAQCAQRRALVTPAAEKAALARALKNVARETAKTKPHP